MRIDVLTLFPAMFPGYLGQSLLCKAIEQGLVDVQVHDLRTWARDKRQTVDDRPFGGGPGMVLKVEPVVESVEAIRVMADDPVHVVLLTPQGHRFDQATAERLASQSRVLLLCGRYEGFDQRIIDLLQPEELSIGDYVLNGGEVAAMVVIDAVVRLIPGVLGDDRSCHEDSFSGESRRLEHEQYTRPREYRGLNVPEVLLSGDHGKIADWREQRSDQKTRERRADLLPGQSCEPTDRIP